MSQSVKLSNGNYIDAEGVWDATQGKSQSVLNALTSGLQVRAFHSSGTTQKWTITLSVHAPLLLLVDSNGYSNIYSINSSSKVSTLLECEAGYTPTTSLGANGKSVIISLTAKPWSYFLLLTTSDITITANSN